MPRDGGFTATFCCKLKRPASACTPPPHAVLLGSDHAAARLHASSRARQPATRAPPACPDARLVACALPNLPTLPVHAEEVPLGEAPMNWAGRRVRPVDRAPPSAPYLPHPDPLQLNCGATARRGAARSARACCGPRTTACDSAGWAAHCGIDQGYLLVAFIENLASAVLPDPSAARHETVVAPHAMAEFGGGQHSACTSPSTRSTARGAV